MLLLLAGISINMISGQDGILTKAQKSNMATELSQIQEKVGLEIAGKQVEQGTGFDASKYTNLEDFETEIKSKYSEYIGISNGKIYIKSNAGESIKQVAREIGIEVAEVGVQDENGKINIGKVNDIKNYRIYGNTVNTEKILPEEYEQVEYIKSTGTQYIDTGYIPKTNTKLEMNLKFEGEFDVDKGEAFIGGRTGDDIFSVNFGGNDIKQKNELYFWIDKTSTSGGEVYRTTITDEIKYNKNLLSIESGNVEYAGNVITVAEKTNNHTDSILIYGYKYDGNIMTFGAYNMYVYDLKIYEGEELKRNMIPCYRKEDNKVGMYDLVNNTFYTNNGEGEFVSGSSSIDMNSVGNYNEANNQYEIPVTVSGKNIFNIDSNLNNFLSKNSEGIYTIKKQANNSMVSIPIFIPANTTYAKSVEILEFSVTPSTYTRIPILIIFEDGTSQWSNIYPNSSRRRFKCLSCWDL